MLKKISIIVFLITAPAASYSQSVDHLEAITRSRICPPNPEQYDWISLDSCNSYQSVQKRVFCQDEIGRKNRKIAEYNRFISDCKRGKSGEAGGNKWSNKLKDAKQRNNSYSNDANRGQEAFQRKTNSVLNEQERIQQQNWDNTQQKLAEERRQAEAARRAAELSRKQAAQAARRSNSTTSTSSSSSGWGEDIYPPGCRNKRSFAACAVDGAGCDRESWESPKVCWSICSGLCNE